MGHVDVNRPVARHSGECRFCDPAGEEAAQKLPRAPHTSAKSGPNHDGTTHASSMDMIGDHIDFISAYCDRWCERCSLTQRCSAFTAQAAVAMCGNDRDGLELAFGRAPNDDGIV